MARIKSATAPSAKLATPTPALPTDTLAVQTRAILDDTKRLQAVSEACGKAYDAGTDMGYDAALKASAAIGYDFAALANWKPVDARVAVPGAEEQAIRDLHNAVEPLSSPKAMEEKKVLLRLLSTASTPDNVTYVQKVLKKNEMPVRATSGLATPEEATTKLNSMLALAKKAKDELNIKNLEKHIDAIDDTTKMAELCASLNADQTAFSRFRKRLFLHLIAPQIAAGVPLAKRGESYREVLGVAVAAHKKFCALSGQDKGGDKAAKLETMVNTAVADHIRDNFGAKEHVAKTNDELGRDACNAIANAARKAAKVKWMDDKEATSLINRMAKIIAAHGHDDWIDPADLAADKAAEKSEAKRQAKIADGKIKPARSTKAKRNGKATPARRAKAPPSVVESTTDEVMSDMLPA